MTDPSDASVSFSVKELIGRVDAKLDILLARVDEKASRDSLERLSGRVDALETEAATSRAVSTTTRWLLFTALPAAVGVGAAAAAILR